MDKVKQVNKQSTTDANTKSTDVEKYHKVGTVHEADHYMKQDYIIHGYRINFDSWKKIFKSLLMVHNETVNVWSHLVGAILIIVCIFYTAVFIHYHKEIITDFDFTKLNSEIKDLTDPIFPKISTYASSFYNTTLDIIHLADSKIDQYQNLLNIKVNCISCVKDILNYFSEMKENLTNIIKNSHINEEFTNLLEYISNKEQQWLQFYNESTNYKEELLNLPKWPLFIMLLGGVICLGCSATFHLSIAHSEKVNNFFNRLDYAGISLLIVGSSYPPNYYLFNCDISKYNIN